MFNNSAFPVRIKLRSPHPITDGEPSLISVWLHNKIGRGNYALHILETLPNNEAAFYFRRVEHALAFLQAFPELELADSVGSHLLTSRESRQKLVR